jgi:hypothetical protein
VTQALKNMEGEYGKDHIEKTLKKFYDADKEVYEKTVKEHEERISGILKYRKT